MSTHSSRCLTHTMNPLFYEFHLPIKVPLAYLGASTASSPYFQALNFSTLSYVINHWISSIGTCFLPPMLHMI